MPTSIPPVIPTAPVHLASMLTQTQSAIPEPVAIECRADGTVLVRVPSRRDVTNPLPDAVFTFRAGDPQYSYWYQRWSSQRSGPVEAV